MTLLLCNSNELPRALLRVDVRKGRPCKMETTTPGQFELAGSRRDQRGQEAWTLCKTRARDLHPTLRRSAGAGSPPEPFES